MIIEIIMLNTFNCIYSNLFSSKYILSRQQQREQCVYGSILHKENEKRQLKIPNYYFLSSAQAV